VRVRVCFGICVAFGGIIATLALNAQINEENRTPVLKAHAVSSASPDESPSSTPKAKGSPHKKKSTSPSPKPKSKAKSSATPKEEADVSPTPKETPEPTAKAKGAKKKGAAKQPPPTLKKKKKPTPEEAESSSPHKARSPKVSETPLARAATPVAPRAVAVPSPGGPPLPPSTTSAGEPEQLTIEKYGYEKPKTFWERLFGVRRGGSSGAGYRYLTRSVRDQIDRAPVRQGRWQFIVVHNSGTRQGNAAAFDYYHRHVRRMQNGLAYHFVIGNGTSTGNGQIEVGDRWRRQINGGHVHSDYLNNIALGICLVGDFNRDQPTRAQLDCCEELIRYLRQRCGKVGSHYPIVKPHREMNPPRWPTDCPGDVFPYSWFRRFQE
jgi:hypothetical protein